MTNIWKVKSAKIMVVGVKKSTGKKVGEKIGKGKIGSKNNVGEKRKSKEKWR